MPRAGHLWALPLLFALALAGSSLAHAEEEPAEVLAEEPTRSRRAISNQGLGLRAGFLVHNLSPSEEQLPFLYLDLGLRHKAGEYYFDLRLPGAAILLDGLWYLFNEFVLNRRSRLAIERLNRNYAYWEIGHGRLAYRWELTPPETFQDWEVPLDLAIGLFGTADLLFLYNLPEVDQDDLLVYGYDDPFVLGAGAFAALGRTTERMQFDVALGLGWGVRGIEVEPERRVGIILLDADFLFEIGAGFGAYIRPRVTTYITRLSRPLAFGTGLTAGVNVRF